MCENLSLYFGSDSCCMFVDALVFGDHPDMVKKRAGTRIPAFTKQESKQVKGIFDFIGINHYNTVPSIKNNPEKLKIMKMWA